MSEPRKDKPIDWTDTNCEIVRMAMFFDVFMKMTEGQQNMILKILTRMKTPKATGD